MALSRSGLVFPGKIALYLHLLLYQRPLYSLVQFDSFGLWVCFPVFNGVENSWHRQDRGDFYVLLVRVHVLPWVLHQKTGQTVDMPIKLPWPIMVYKTNGRLWLFVNYHNVIKVRVGQQWV